ncbi:M18 family aminopeptidase [Nakamurella leprariae]|uniref:M18 family aminopeptidase n=1 Tax=Nakamurella leprariae TaxID=2803911 RepID=A0A938YIA6_9ACTN|nr:M18 family aminopeptidase [Nakamurella leprariae]MBM9468305.1 M18 family aminopeptidase [Nakamurella leprariae]
MTTAPAAGQDDLERAGLADLAAFLRASPGPFHAVAEAATRLRAEGFTEHRWPRPGAPGDDPLRPGGHWLVRDGALIAWVVPAGATAGAPLRIFAAHTDSPALRIKPHPDTGVAGWRQLGVEVYGGALWNSWLDRDLGLAGRVVLRDGTVLPVFVDRPLLRVPQLAIHLDRSVNQGLTLDPQRQLTPVWGLGRVAAGDLLEFLAAELGVAAGDIAAHDLITVELSPPALLGRDRELFAAGRLDNLVSVHAGLDALLQLRAADPQPDAPISVLAAFDHEEVGSDTATGAGGPLLGSVLTLLAGGDQAPGVRAGVFAESRCLSVDVTHAVHPGYLDRYEPEHLCLPNGGPALKVNAVQRYATDAPGAAAWTRACARAGVPSQVFVSRNTVPCGSTVGPILATRLGIRTVDVGIPVLSMHSVRELCGAQDPARLTAAAVAFLSDPV